MRRFETLNPETKDLVQCLLPALASSFGVSDPLDIIPEDIRMRAWDCERRDHIKGETENDPRNWGVQFLKDLMAISRLKNGDLAAFQADLYAKCALHEPKHPWCRLNDIRELKDEYEHPERKNKAEVEESSESSSTDSYFEELVEPDALKGTKRRRGGIHEVYEARVMEKRHKREWRILPSKFQPASTNAPQTSLVAFADPSRVVSNAMTRLRRSANAQVVHQTALITLPAVRTVLFSPTMIMTRT